MIFIPDHLHLKLVVLRVFLLSDCQTPGEQFPCRNIAKILTEPGDTVSPILFFVLFRG